MTKLYDRKIKIMFSNMNLQIHDFRQKDALLWRKHEVFPCYMPDMYNLFLEIVTLTLKPGNEYDKLLRETCKEVLK